MDPLVEPQAYRFPQPLTFDALSSGKAIASPHRSQPYHHHETRPQWAQEPWSAIIQSQAAHTPTPLRPSPLEKSPNLDRTTDACGYLVPSMLHPSSPLHADPSAYNTHSQQRSHAGARGLSNVSLAQDLTSTIQPNQSESKPQYRITSSDPNERTAQSNLGILDSGFSTPRRDRNINYVTSGGTHYYSYATPNSHLQLASPISRFPQESLPLPLHSPRTSSPIRPTKDSQYGNITDIGRRYQNTHHKLHSPFNQTLSGVWLSPVSSPQRCGSISTTEQRYIADESQLRYLSNPSSTLEVERFGQGGTQHRVARSLDAFSPFTLTPVSKRGVGLGNQPVDAMNDSAGSSTKRKREASVLPSDPPSELGREYEENQQEEKKQRKKTVMACHFCRHRKLKCDGRRPTCSHCTSRSQQCSYDTFIRRRGPGRKTKLINERARIETAERSEVDHHGEGFSNDPSPPIDLGSSNASSHQGAPDDEDIVYTEESFAEFDQSRRGSISQAQAWDYSASSPVQSSSFPSGTSSRRTSWVSECSAEPFLSQGAWAGHGVYGRTAATSQDGSPRTDMTSYQSTCVDERLFGQPSHLRGGVPQQSLGHSDIYVGAPCNTLVPQGSGYATAGATLCTADGCDNPHCTRSEEYGTLPQSYSRSNSMLVPGAPVDNPGSW